MSSYPSDLEIASAANKISIDKVAATIDITDEAVSYTHLTLPTT